MTPPRVWAVYTCHNSYPVVWPLTICRSGEYVPVETPDMPLIDPLPLSVHSTRAAATRALNLLLHSCAGTA